MKRLLLLWALVPTWLPADISVNLDQVAAEEEVPVATGMALHLYADFDVDWVSAPAVEASWGFTQNHRDLLLQSASGSPVDLMVDLLLPTQLFGMGIPLSLPFPWLGETSVLGSSHLWAGILQVPFGEFSFHHLYGGREFKQSGLVPDLWTDAGVQWSVVPLAGLSVDLFASNGFSDPNQIFLSPAGAQQHPKAFSARVREDFAPGWFASASVFRDQYGLDNEPSKALTMGGLDLAAKSGPLAYRFSGLFALVQGGAQEWNRSGWYGEVQYLLTSALFLRARGGTMEPDSRNTSADSLDTNLGLVWKTGPVEWDLTAFADKPQSRGSLFSSQDTQYEVLLKILYTL